MGDSTTLVVGGVSWTHILLTIAIAAAFWFVPKRRGRPSSAWARIKGWTRAWRGCSARSRGSR